MSEVWRHELSTSGAYTVRPRNVLRPLVHGLAVWARRFDRTAMGYGDGGVTVQTRSWPMRSDGTRQLTAEVRVADGHALRTYQLGATVPDPAQVPDRMRSCLNGTGYPMNTWWERVLARWAHRRGIRHDRVFGPDDERRWAMRRDGLWLGVGRGR